MSAVALIEQLERHGLKLSAEGDQLVCRGAKRILTPELLRELQRRKPELLRVLARQNLKIVPGRCTGHQRAVPSEFIHALAEAIVADMDGPDV